MLPTGSPLHTSSAVGLRQGTRTLTSDHEGGHSRASSAARKDFCASNNDLHFVDLRVTALKAEESCIGHGGAPGERERACSRRQGPGLEGRRVHIGAPLQCLLVRYSCLALLATAAGHPLDLVRSRCRGLAPHYWRSLSLTRLSAAARASSPARPACSPCLALPAARHGRRACPSWWRRRPWLRGPG